MTWSVGRLPSDRDGSAGAIGRELTSVVFEYSHGFKVGAVTWARRSSSDINRATTRWYGGQPRSS